MAKKYSRLSRGAINKLAPGEKISEHGITATRLPNNDVRYRINVMVDGERIHRTVGYASDGTTRTQAEDFIASVRTKAKEGTLQLPRGRKMPLTFAEAARLYLADQEKTDGKNLVKKRQHLDLHLIPALGKLRVEGITDFRLRTLRKELGGKGLSVASVNRCFATYRHLARWLSRTKRLLMSEVTLEEENNERDYVLSANDETRLLDEALASGHPYLWLFIKAGLGSGLRHSEICSLRFDGFSHEQRTVRVKVKGGRTRDQLITQGLADILDHERGMATDPDGPVFPSPHRKRREGKSATRFSGPYKKAVAAAGLDPTRVVVHTLRHTALTRFASVEQNPKVFMRFSGHRSLAAAMRYIHPSNEHILSRLDQVEGEQSKVTKLQSA